MKLSELQQELRVVDPAAILVSPRVLERVIRQELKLPQLHWRTPHCQGYVVDRHVLFRHVEQDELDLEPDRLLPSTVILLARPAPEELAAQDDRPLLLKYWRRLFHATLHLMLETRCEEGRLTTTDIRQRIEQIGPAEFEEIRRVLTEDGYLAQTADDRTVYIEFAAVYLEFHFFAANLLPAYFPAIRDREAIKQLLSQDVDAAKLFDRTRLAGAPDPVVCSDTSSDESHDYFLKLVGSAERAAAAGNTVRAAILHTRAARVAPVALTLSAKAQAEADLKRLVARLQAALDLEEEEAAAWLQLLPALLDKADQGSRPVEAVLLFELQKVCLEHERDIYALDLVEWLLSAGHRPIKRPLPSQRLVRITKHLRSAAQLLARARVSDADRQHLARLMQAALDASEERLRERFRPLLSETFHDIGLRPTNPPERTAFYKMIEELLDRIIDYGFLTFGDLRDTISRNQLKLPDLAEPDDFVRGDPLLRLDRRLSVLLDGVYRRAEFYLRWLERFTALNFGTITGRALTTFVTIPFGGAFLLVKGLGLILSEVDAPPLSPTANSATLVVTALFLLGLLHLSGFRRLCGQTAALGVRLVRTLFVDLPRRFLQIKVVRKLMGSWPFQLFTAYLIKPLAVCGLLELWLPELFATWIEATITFLAANFVLNSRPGLAVSEALMQTLVQFYDLLRAGLLPGLVRLLLSVFKQAIDMLEYVLFTVDEWLRFRSGDSWFSMAVRTVVGVFWFPISYVSRFYLLVLIEPGVNPVKAPVSYMAAKFLAPFYLPLTDFLADPLAPMLGKAAASTLVFGGIVFWSADIFGFLFWEMKENWSLYRANRRSTLQPVTVGTHGETIGRLLQPGFHSGTLPKLYARLRKAEREAMVTGSWQAVRVCGQHLREVERALQRLVEREVIVLLQQSPHWKGQKLCAGRPALASNRITLKLTHPAFPTEPVWLDIENRAGWLVAGLRGPGWLERVTPPQRQAVLIALAGLYKIAGIDVVREQLEANLPPEVHCYDITANDLVLWLDRRSGQAILYDWADAKLLLRPRTANGKAAPDWPALDARRLLFRLVPITWQQWVETWKKDQEGQTLVAPFSAEVRLLPAEASSLEGPKTMIRAQFENPPPEKVNRA